MAEENVEEGVEEGGVEDEGFEAVEGGGLFVEFVDSHGEEEFDSGDEGIG